MQLCTASAVAAFAAPLRQRVSRVALRISIVSLNCHVIYSCLMLPHHTTVYGLVLLCLLVAVAQIIGVRATLLCVVQAFVALLMLRCCKFMQPG